MSTTEPRYAAGAVFVQKPIIPLDGHSRGAGATLQRLFSENADDFRLARTHLLKYWSVAYQRQYVVLPLAPNHSLKPQ